VSPFTLARCLRFACLFESVAKTFLVRVAVAKLADGADFLAAVKAAFDPAAEIAVVFPVDERAGCGSLDCAVAVLLLPIPPAACVVKVDALVCSVPVAPAVRLGSSKSESKSDDPPRSPWKMCDLLASRLRGWGTAWSRLLRFLGDVTAACFLLEPAVVGRASSSSEAELSPGRI